MRSVHVPAAAIAAIAAVAGIGGIVFSACSGSKDQPAAPPDVGEAAAAPAEVDKLADLRTGLQAVVTAQRASDDPGRRRACLDVFPKMEAAVDAIGEEDKKLAQLAGEIRSLCGETAETTSILRAASKMPKIDASGAFANAFTPEALKKSFEDAKKVRKSGGDPGPKCVNMELMIDHLSKNPDQAKNKKTKKLLEEASTFCISFGAIGSVRHHIAEAKAAREASKQASFSEHCVHAVEQLSKARQSASKEELTATVGTLCIEAVSLKDKFGHGPS